MTDLLPGHEALTMRTFKTLIRDDPERLRLRIQGMGTARRRELARALRAAARQSEAIAQAMDGERNAAWPWA